MSLMGVYPAVTPRLGQVVPRTRTHTHRLMAILQVNHAKLVVLNLLPPDISKQNLCGWLWQILYGLDVLWHYWLGGRKGIRPVKSGGWWRWALVSPDGVAPSQMVGVSASVDLPLHHKFQKFSSGTGSCGWSRKRGHKTVVCVCVCGCPSCYPTNSVKTLKATQSIDRNQEKLPTNINLSWSSHRLTPGRRDVNASSPTSVVVLPPYMHTQPFNGPFSGTIWVSRCQKKSSGLLWYKGR